MPSQKRRIVILGSTGSIGRNALEVVAAFPDRLEVLGLAARRNSTLLLEQVRRFQPRWAVLTDETLRSRVEPDTFRPTVLRFGESALGELAQESTVDLVLVAIIGAAGLLGAWSAIEAGKIVALANKEAMVLAGPLLLQRAQQCHALILPVDSEHSAVFQILQGRNKEELARIVLTASGGPFRGQTRAALEQVTALQALNHPTWHMGPKITIDSATLMNKALEIVEARWLFDVAPEQIVVLIHPESVVHGFVEMRDGAVFAQLSPPDMRLPIQYALLYPERWPGPAKRLDWWALRTLHFEPPDVETFPALELGYQVARQGGLSGAVLNAANEVAVEYFLQGRCRFLDIPRVCRAVLEAYLNQAEGRARPSATLGEAERLSSLATPSALALSALTLENILAADHWARQEAHRWLSS
ncbi:MAG: 1-deoxy-D-xylulose-5-phosphate reductoisomerase [Gemmatales bacterium]|nr:1-deoxy-D-xylulose-5-phosphate reductoisomerase [Gemmatales bacterium]MCS7159615.1 1-deoxy-D-xylulose-5-phosphate reductoisomerase [Gemmatales bacterium]MDW8174813.1 1-deoxy-D-xylulose-5-phosphate reductoisomerase [Gemmatales bacterium]MDW8221376.1 1-deoxy-D-xylulose-5-phosphate reductoisomerase [Gemmatales bacterium]